MLWYNLRMAPQSNTQPRLTVVDLEFVPSRTYAAQHACGALIIGKGDEMRAALEHHTNTCQAHA